MNRMSQRDMTTNARYDPSPPYDCKCPIRPHPPIRSNTQCGPNQEDYVLDPHTAVGVYVAERLGLSNRTVCLATAHPAKFPSSIEEAIGTAATHPSLEKLKGKPEKYEKLGNDQQAVMAFMSTAIDAADTKKKVDTEHCTDSCAIL